MPNVPLIDPNLHVTATVGPAAGTGAVAVITASSFSGDRGRCGVTLGTGLGAGVVVSIAGIVDSATIASALTMAPGVLAVGSFDDAPVRPIVVTTLPAPPDSVHIKCVPTFDSPPAGIPKRMIGFDIRVSTLPVAAQNQSFVFAWAIL